MNEKIKNYIDELFVDGPKTRKAMELKEELAINTMEKYQDLISEGYQEDDAWQMVISSIGDVTELFEELKEDNPLRLSEADRQKKAVLNAAAAGLYLFAIAVYLAWMILARNIVFAGDRSRLGLVFVILICIPATCILIYAANMYPDFNKGDDSLVEDYKKARYAKNRKRAIHSSVSAIIWLVTLILYFIISFATFSWEVTWIIFLIGACAQAIAVLVFNLQKEK